MSYMDQFGQAIVGSLIAQRDPMQSAMIKIMGREVVASDTAQLSNIQMNINDLWKKHHELAKTRDELTEHNKKAEQLKNAAPTPADAVDIAKMIVFSQHYIQSIGLELESIQTSIGYWEELRASFK